MVIGATWRQSRKLIEDIDRYALETQPSIEVYQLEHINSEAATTLVGELYTEILAERTGQVSIRSLGEPNAILLIGREESVAVVKELIQKIDQPSPPSSRFEVFRLKNVSAVDAEQTVRNFFVNRPGFDTTPRSSLGARIQIIGDYRTNSLIVQASPRDMEEVRRLIETLDVEESQSAAVLRGLQAEKFLGGNDGHHACNPPSREKVPRDKPVRDKGSRARDSRGDPRRRRNRGCQPFRLS